MASWKPSRNNFGRSATELLKLSWRERWTLVQAFVLCPKLAISLRLVGFRRLRSFLARMSPGPSDPSDGAALERAQEIAHLVAAAASRHLFPISCLPRSLTLWWLLRWRGIGSDIRLGVRQEEGEFQAHAWVEMDGTVLNDSPDVHERYAAFDPIQWPQGAKWV